MGPGGAETRIPGAGQLGLVVVPLLLLRAQHLGQNKKPLLLDR